MEPATDTTATFAMCSLGDNGTRKRDGKEENKVQYAGLFDMFDDNLILEIIGRHVFSNTFITYDGLRCLRAFGLTCHRMYDLVADSRLWARVEFSRVFCEIALRRRDSSVINIQGLRHFAKNCQYLAHYSSKRMEILRLHEIMPSLKYLVQYSGTEEIALRAPEGLSATRFLVQPGFEDFYEKPEAGVDATAAAPLITTQKRNGRLAMWLEAVHRTIPSNTNTLSGFFPSPIILRSAINALKASIGESDFERFAVQVMVQMVSLVILSKPWTQPRSRTEFAQLVGDVMGLVRVTPPTESAMTGACAIARLMSITINLTAAEFEGIWLPAFELAETQGSPAFAAKIFEMSAITCGPLFTLPLNSDAAVHWDHALKVYLKAMKAGKCEVAHILAAKNSGSLRRLVRTVGDARLVVGSTWDSIVRNGITCPTAFDAFAAAIGRYFEVCACEGDSDQFPHASAPVFNSNTDDAMQHLECMGLITVIERAMSRDPVDWAPAMAFRRSWPHLQLKHPALFNAIKGAIRGVIQSADSSPRNFLEAQRFIDFQVNGLVEFDQDDRHIGFCAELFDVANRQQHAQWLGDHTGSASDPCVWAATTIDSLMHRSPQVVCRSIEAATPRYNAVHCSSIAMLYRRLIGNAFGLNINPTALVAAYIKHDMVDKLIEVVNAVNRNVKGGRVIGASMAAMPNACMKASQAHVCNGDVRCAFCLLGQMLHTKRTQRK